MMNDNPRWMRRAGTYARDKHAVAQLEAAVVKRRRKAEKRLKVAKASITDPLQAGEGVRQ